MNYRYKISIFSVTDFLAMATLNKYTLEWRHVELPYFRIASRSNLWKYGDRWSVAYAFFEHYQTAQVFISLLHFIAIEYELGTGDSYTLVEKKDNGQLEVLERGLCRIKRY